MKGFVLLLVALLGWNALLLKQQGMHIPRDNANKDSLFFINILHDQSNNSYLLSLNIQAPDYEGCIVIENFLLYRFIALTQNMNWKEYQNYMLELLLRGDTLRTNIPINEVSASGTTKQWAFRIVQPDKEVAAYTQQGKEAFINHFFIKINDAGTAGVLKEESYDDLNDEARINRFFSIASQLFKWRIYSSQRGVSGNLLYSTEGPPEQIRKQWLQEEQSK